MTFGFIYSDLVLVDLLPLETNQVTYMFLRPIIVFLPFSGVASCDEGSEAEAAEASLVSSFELSPFGGLWKHIRTDQWILLSVTSTSENWFHYNPNAHTSTRSDIFCPKTNFAPLSVFFVALFELKGQELNTSRNQCRENDGINWAAEMMSCDIFSYYLGVEMYCRK